MDSVFTKAYLRVIKEDADEVGDDYVNLVKQVVAEKDHWDPMKKQAVENLLIGFRKVNKEGILALQEKAAELMKTPAFVEEFAALLQNFDQFPFDYEAWAQLQEEFAEMMENPNHDARRAFMFKAADFLEDTPAKTVVELDRIETALRELFAKYSQY